MQNIEHEHEKGNMGRSPYMKLGISDHENYPILEYSKRENMKLGTWNNVILKFELGNLQGSLGSPQMGCLMQVACRMWFVLRTSQKMI